MLRKLKLALKILRQLLYRPNTWTPRLSASCRAPSEPKMCVWCRQLGHWKTLMFCTRPRTCRETGCWCSRSSTSHAGFKASAQITGTLTFLNISAPLRASSRAKSCGVDTMTAPDNAEANVNEAKSTCPSVRPDWRYLWGSV